MSSTSETSSVPPRRKTVEKFASWIKRLDSNCYEHQLLTFSCQKSRRLLQTFVVYRWTVTLLWLITVVVTLGDLGRPSPDFARDASYYLKYFIFISNHALVLVLAQATIAAFIVTCSAVSYNFENHPSLPHAPVGGVGLVYWKLYEFSTCLALSVTVTYWLMIHPLRKTPSDLNNYLTHLVNSIFAIADWLITGLPHNLSDAWIGLLYGWCYMVFTIVYWYSGGTTRTQTAGEAARREIYKGCSDWDRIGMGIGCFFWLGCVYCMSHVILCVANALLRKCQPSTSVLRSESSGRPTRVRFRRRESYLP